MSVWFKHTSSVKVQLQYSAPTSSSPVPAIPLMFFLLFAHASYIIFQLIFKSSSSPCPSYILSLIICSVSHLLTVLSVLVCCCFTHLLLSDCEAVLFTILVSLLLSCCIVSSWSTKKINIIILNIQWSGFILPAASTSSFLLTTILFIQVAPLFLS